MDDPPLMRTRVEMIPLIEDLNRWAINLVSLNANTPAGDLYDECEARRERTLRESPKEWLEVAVDLLITPPTAAEFNEAYGREFYQAEPDEATIEQWFIAVSATLETWAQLIPDYAAEKLRPVVHERGERRQILLMAASGIPEFLPLLQRVADDFATLEDDDQALLLDIVSRFQTPESRKLALKLEQKINSQSPIGPEAAATLNRVRSRGYLIDDGTGI
jgi:hypothetical protein